MSARPIPPLPSPTADDAPHELLDVLTIAFVAALCGAQDCAGFAAFAAGRQALFRSLLAHPMLPSESTFDRVLALPDPARFGHVFGRFLDHFGRDGDGVLAIGPEALRRSYEDACADSPFHAKIAFGPGTRVAIAGRRAAGIDGGLLDPLALDGALVIGDAGGAPQAEFILRRGGQYLLALSPTQPAMLRAVERHFAGRIPAPGGHIISDDTGWLAAEEPVPAGLTTVACIESAGAAARRYFLSSAPLTGASLAHALRGNWSITRPHCWILELDANRCCDGSAENLRTLHRLATDVLRKARPRLQLARKRHRATQTDTFARTIIGQMR